MKPIIEHKNPLVHFEFGIIPAFGFLIGIGNQHSNVGMIFIIGPFFLGIGKP